MTGHLIAPGVEHPWELGCRTCQREAEERVAELEAALERLVRPPALNLRDPANSGDLEAARHALKGKELDG